MKILPFIYEIMSAMQKGCTDWHYLCAEIIKQEEYGKVYK